MVTPHLPWKFHAKKNTTNKQVSKDRECDVRMRRLENVLFFAVRNPRMLSHVVSSDDQPHDVPQTADNTYKHIAAT